MLLSFVCARKISFNLKVPLFKGSQEDMLRKTCIWVSIICPSRKFMLEEIAVIMGITRERVRQLEASALRKLRHPSRAKILAELID